MKEHLESESDRIRQEFRRREEQIPADFYSLCRPANLFSRHGKERALLEALRRAKLLPLAERRLLDIGCGRGDWLAVFENFEARRELIAGIDLDGQRAEVAARRFAGADIREGDAAELPWPDRHFDIVFQSTVFTSILDEDMKRAVAAQMVRVLKPHGAIIWYDFLMNNPRNSQVRGIGRREITSLFPGFEISLRRVTLAPPLMRRVVPISWSLAALLEKMRLLNVFYLAVLRRDA